MRISHKKMALVKNSVLISTIALLILMPADLIHLLAVLIHYFYESMAFAIEELLTHGLGLSKFHAQMIVFYLSLAIGLLGGFLFIRSIPKMLALIKAGSQQWYKQIRGNLMTFWQRFYARWKLELQFAEVIGLGSLILWFLVL